MFEPPVSRQKGWPEALAPRSMKLPHDAPLKTVQVNRLRLVESKQSVRAPRTRQVGGPAIEPPMVVQERGPSADPSFSTSWAAWLRAQQPIPAGSWWQSG